MSTNELDSVEMLLGQVLIDPRGFAERLLEQLLSRYADPSALVPPPVQGRADDSWPDPASGPLEPTARPTPAEADANLLLAAALGACDCWGSDMACRVCRGEGIPGWAEPDAELFGVYVAPAVARVHRPPTARADTGKPFGGDITELTTQGEST